MREKLMAIILVILLASIFLGLIYLDDWATFTTFLIVSVTVSVVAAILLSPGRKP